jgi:hypothetical protein
MALALMKTYDALKEAGAPEDKARAAAEELAEYENRFASMEGKLSLLQWQVGYLMVITTGIALRLIFS